MEYKYLFIDAQWLLTRNFKMKCNQAKEDGFYQVDGKLVPDAENKPIRTYVANFTPGELATSFFQSVTRFITDTVDVEKVILLWDKYPYHKFKFLEDYKGDRYYAKEEDLEKLDPIKDAQAYVDMALEVEQNQLKQQAKALIINHFGEIGLPSFWRVGYEADDLAGEIAKYLTKNEPRKCLFFSIDSDWDFLIQPGIDHITPRGKITTYEDMINLLQRDLEVGEVNLYQYKSYVDSVIGSHNNLTDISGPEVKTHSWGEIIQALKHDQDGYVTDKERFKNQLRSFSVSEYPEYDIVQGFMKDIETCGSLADTMTFSIFAGEHGLSIYNNYYEGFKSRLNQSLYKSNTNGLFGNN